METMLQLLPFHVFVILHQSNQPSFFQNKLANNIIWQVIQWNTKHCIWHNHSYKNQCQNFTVTLFFKINHKYNMHSIATLSRSGQFWNSFRAVSRLITQCEVTVRWYAKDPPCDTSKPNPDCRRAHADIKPDVDPNCPVPCETRKSKKKGILHKIKLKVIEGGTNFGSKLSYRNKFLFLLLGSNL